MDDITEYDCCGNGCANCILDIKPIKYTSADTYNKQNVLEKYTNFILVNKTLHNPKVKDVWELHFKSTHCNDKNYALIVYAGHHLMMRRVLIGNESLKNNSNDADTERKYLLRPYSPFWWNEAEMEFKILINLIPNGPMSGYIENLQLYDEVEFRGPLGTYKHQIDANGNKYILIISQGIAITSALTIIKEIINNEDDLSRILHIACFKDLRYVYFRENLSNYSKFWNYKVHIFLTKEVCNNTDCKRNLNCIETCHNFKSKLKYNEIIKPNRLTEKELINLVDTINCAKENTTVIISGNGSFQSSYKSLCQTDKVGFLNKNIHLL